MAAKSTVREKAIQQRLHGGHPPQSPAKKSTLASVVKKLVPSTDMQMLPANELLTYALPPRKKHWSALITDHQIGMIAGPRGKGKTWFGLGIAVAMSTGAPFLGRAPKNPRRVRYLDGEMDLATVQKRVQLVHSSLGVKPSSNLKIFTPESYSDLLPAITSVEGQKKVDQMLGVEWDVLIIDNYSVWSGDGRETSESWQPLMRWMLGHKHAGRAVIVVHHTGKNGVQRGSSRHEDALDWSIVLKPVDVATKGALCFSLEWAKCRHLAASESQPITVTMAKNGDSIAWSYVDGAIDSADKLQAKKLKAEGKTNAEIATALGVNRSTVGRWLPPAT